MAVMIAHATPSSEPKQRYQLLVGDSVLVPTNGMYRVSVGNARAIQAVPVDPSELLLIGGLWILESPHLGKGQG